MSKINNRYLAPIVFLLAFLVFWELTVQIVDLPKWLLPSPREVLKALKEFFPVLIDHSLSTIAAAVVGLVAAIIVAICVAILMDFSGWLKKGLYPLLIVSQTIPIITVAPLFMIWFGLGLLPKVIVVALVCFFPIVVSLIQGMESVEPDILKMVEVMGVNRFKVFKMIKFPASLPAFFGGLKIAGTYAVMGAVIGEWLGAKKGLGVFITRSMHAYRLDRVLAAVFVITVLSLLLFLFINILAKIIMPWYFRERRDL